MVFDLNLLPGGGTGWTGHWVPAIPVERNCIFIGNQPVTPKCCGAEETTTYLCGTVLNPTQFLLNADRPCTRPGGFAANINDVRAIGDQLLRMCQCGITLKFG